MKTIGTVMTVLGILVSATSLLAQDSSHCGHKMGGHQHATEEQMTHEGHGMEADSSTDECDWMMERQQEMTTAIGAMDARLDALIRQMDAVEGEARSEAIAEVVRELVWQRKQLQEKTTTLHADMMYHVGSHMGTTTAEGMRSMDQDCPMMRGMAESTQPDSENSHTGHQH